MVLKPRRWSKPPKGPRQTFYPGGQEDPLCDLSLSQPTGLKSPDPSFDQAFIPRVYQEPKRLPWTHRHRESGDLSREPHRHARTCSPNYHRFATLHAQAARPPAGSQSPGQAGVSKGPARQLIPPNSQTPPPPSPFNKTGQSPEWTSP